MHTCSLVIELQRLLFSLNAKVASDLELYLNSNFESLLPIPLAILTANSASSSRMVRKKVFELLDLLREKTPTFDGSKEPLSVIPGFAHAKLQNAQALYSFLSKNAPEIEANDNWIQNKMPQLLEQVPALVEWLISAANGASAFECAEPLIPSIVQLLVPLAAQKPEIVAFLTGQLEKSIQAKNPLLFQESFALFAPSNAHILQKNAAIFTRCLSAFAASCLEWKQPKMYRFIHPIVASPFKQEMANCALFDVLAKDLSLKNEFSAFPLDQIPIVTGLVESCIASSSEDPPASKRKCSDGNSTNSNASNLLALFIEFFLLKATKNTTTNAIGNLSGRSII